MGASLWSAAHSTNGSAGSLLCVSAASCSSPPARRVWVLPELWDSHVDCFRLVCPLDTRCMRGAHASSLDRCSVCRQSTSYMHADEMDVDEVRRQPLYLHRQEMSVASNSDIRFRDGGTIRVSEGDLQGRHRMPSAITAFGSSTAMYRFSET